METLVKIEVCKSADGLYWLFLTKGEKVSHQLVSESEIMEELSEMLQDIFPFDLH